MTLEAAMGHNALIIIDSFLEDISPSKPNVMDGVLPPGRVSSHHWFQTHPETGKSVLIATIMSGTHVTQNHV